MRSYLQEGTVVRVPGGILYKIIGEPMGEGGGSIIYPALRMAPEGEGYRESHIPYALKECFPESERYKVLRDEAGEICAMDRASGEKTAEAAGWLQGIRQMQRKEEDISGRIYARAFRLTPILESYSEVELALPGREFKKVKNQIAIMESLHGKGESVKHLLREKKYLNAREAFSVIRQVILAVGEVHREGYLHLDIQDGNVFIKGALEEGDSLISLMDFGSARPLAVDGLCEEIADGLLYSTRGFMAPEILLGNDGHLRLGRQADLYSIGCLLLLLLTGHRYTTAELLRQTGENYIPRFALRKTQCSGHLVDKMQGILAKALKKDPAERYATTAEMLTDVEELLSLLEPKKDPLSALEYDAFISYRHHAEDQAAARALRNSLERYKDGWSSDKKIRRVFLDEGELSACADFGERIRQALKNSGWLIVICSRQTRDSIWVNEEIRTFLKYHDKEHVLAVIIDGEPDEVFPEEFKKNGMTAETFLAADARGADRREVVKKIRGDVKLRIAAPILRTTFDALKGRSRMYQMQKAFAAIAAVLVILAAFSGYAAVQANRIAARDRRISEQAAVIIGEQARGAYESNDYARAVQLSLEFLSLKEPDREERIQTKEILIKSLNLYVRPKEATALALPVAVMRDADGEELNACSLSRDGSRLFTLSDHMLSVFHTADGSTVSCLKENAFFQESHFDFWEELRIEDRGWCILWSEDRVMCYDYESGEPVWVYARETEHGSIRQILLNENKKTIYVLGYSQEHTSAVIEEIDVETGDLTNQHEFSGDYARAFSHRCAASLDGRYIAAEGFMEGGGFDYIRGLFIFDLAQKTVDLQELGRTDAWASPRTTEIFFDAASRIWVSRYEGATGMPSVVNAEYTIEPKTYSLGCYDIQTKSWVGRYETSAPDDVDLRGLRVPLLLRTNPTGAPVIVVAVGNTILLVDGTTGSLRKKIQLDAAVLSLEWREDQLQAVLNNGTIVQIPEDPESQSCVAVDHFPSGIYLVCGREGTYYVVNGSAPDTVIQYQCGVYDESYRETRIEDITPEEYLKSLPLSDSFPEQSLTPDGKRFIECRKDGLGLYDKKGKLLTKLQFPYELSGRERLLFYPEDGTLFYGDGYSGYLIDYDDEGMTIVKKMNDVVGYDAESGEFILADYMDLLLMERMEDSGDGFTEGRLRYHSLGDIIAIAQMKIG